ncbi:hypothetical protein H6758_05025 [Candidatus Nomurabacteria bacterium]|nr:hypothetical protein [Candidatus Nomurabacteria bacterium]
MTIQEMQRLQKVHDDTYYDHTLDMPTDIRHATLHLAKLVGKLAQYSEPADHGRPSDPQKIKDEVTPDLLFWALHFANIFEIDLEESYQSRLSQAKMRIDASRDTNGV